jgi:hypothetical protein
MKLQLYYPVKRHIVGQKFGETAYLDYYKNNGVYFTGHNGMDLSAAHGQEVRASHGGIVEVQVDTKQGHGVVIVSDTPFEYKGGEAYFKTIYWHLIDNIPVKTGDKVTAGEVIGYADSTGLSTGDHLHFGLKPMAKNPNGTYYNLEPTNGYTGAIDPAPYFNGLYAEDLKIPKFIFNKDLSFGDRNEDVRQLQLRLQRDGYFPRDVTATGLYGSITKQAVYDFQMENIVDLSWMARNVFRGYYCSEKTRKALNAL